MRTALRPRNALGRLVPQEAEQRFWEKVSKVGLASNPDCWEWIGARTSYGYGSFWTGSRVDMAHRFSYYLAKGPIPKGLTIDHLCRNRNCVNPAHLEAVTNKENILRGESLSAKNARSTKCARGHEYTRCHSGRRAGTRLCRICANKQSREWKRKYRLRKKGLL